MENMIKNDEGFMLLVEAMMAQAYKDAELGNNEKLRNEALSFIEKMKKEFT